MYDFDISKNYDLKILKYHGFNSVLPKYGHTRLNL